jgi:hypothetical protein
MPRLNCPSCAAGVAVPPERMGQRVRCGRCKAVFDAEDVPVAAAISAPERPPGRYRWNAWQLSGFGCWAVGAALVLVPAVALVSMLNSSLSQPATFAERLGAPACVLILFSGIVALAAGNTLHKVGTGRERM